MRLLLVLCLSLLSAWPAFAKGEKAGVFDYYILALDWSPTWCTLTGDATNSPECTPGRGLTFKLHGLWPQNDVGYPYTCPSNLPDPTQADNEAMADVMGGAGLARYEWVRHGRCTGLPAADYFALMRKAYGTITVPPLFATITHTQPIAASAVEDAFVQSNPTLSPKSVTVMCKGNRIDSVRICLTRDLQPRDCGADAAKDCSLHDAELDAVR